MTLSPGTLLGPYQTEAPLGAGGMGEVYRAKNTRLDRAVAVKMLPARVSEDPRLQQRSERKARALAGLSHPRICTLHDVGHERGVRFLVMELLEGETLAARLDRGALPLDQVIDTGIEIADALDAAHRRGVVHRDVNQTESVRSELIWKNRNGRTVGRVGSPGAYTDVTLGPEGREVAVALIDPQTGAGDIWIIELDRDVTTRFTSGAGDDVVALWSPDGRRIAFSSARDTPPFMHVKSVTGGDEKVLLPSRGTLQVPNDWSPDGRNIIYSDRDPSTDWDLWILPLDGERDPVPFLRTPFKELTASFSPDGNWVAYASDESGRLEVYVTPFPGAGERRRVSTGGGYLPYWRDDGNELFYFSLDNRLMAVPVSSGPRFEPEAPIALFSIEPAKNAYLPYDASPDGERFIFISALPGEAITPTVVTGWSALLPR